MDAFTIPCGTSGLKERTTKVAITKFGSIFLTSVPELMNACRGTINLNVFHLKERNSPQQRTKEGPPKRRRPFARVTGHPYDSCFKKHHVEGFQGRRASCTKMFVKMNPESGHLLVCVLLLPFTLPATSHFTCACCIAHAQPSPSKKRCIS